MSFSATEGSDHYHRRGAGEADGQRHDRIAARGQQDLAMAVGADVAEEEVHVSISQRMLSAVTGSILTSLLGRVYSHVNRKYGANRSVLVTPLDVVRVRLQSQEHTSPGPSNARHPHSVPASASFSNLPPSLGVSSCCREVFWVNNNAPYCVAGPNLAVTNNPLSGSTVTPNTTVADCAAEETQRKTFTSTLDGLRKIARNEGPRTLWRGLSPTLVMAIPANVIYFAGYDWLRTSSRSPLQKVGVNDTYAPLVAGSTARVLAAVAVSPIEMFRTRMQASSSASAAGHFQETLHGLREMAAENGIRSLWRGLNLTLWRDVPFSAIYWWGYEYGRDLLSGVRERARGREKVAGGALSRTRSRSRSMENHTATLVDSFVAGASSGAVAALVTTPFDVGKTKQQVARHYGHSTLGGANAEVRPEDKSMPRFLWHIFKEQGTSGLFKGWAARCLKVAPACAIMISSYELGKKMAVGMNERRDARSH